MANAVTLQKQPWEKLPVYVDFSENMEDDESINVGLSSVVAYDSNDEDVSDTLLKDDSIAVVDTTKLQITVIAGTDGSKYVLSFRAYVSENKWLEEDVKLKVKD